MRSRERMIQQLRNTRRSAYSTKFDLFRNKKFVGKVLCCNTGIYLDRVQISTYSLHANIATLKRYAKIGLLNFFESKIPRSPKNRLKQTIVGAFFEISLQSEITNVIAQSIHDRVIAPKDFVRSWVQTF